MQKKVIKLTKDDGKKVLIGVDSIIDVEEVVQNSMKTINPKIVGLSKVQSRHAMVTSCYVIESVDEIYELINS